MNGNESTKDDPKALFVENEAEDDTAVGPSRAKSIDGIVIARLVAVRADAVALVAWPDRPAESAFVARMLTNLSNAHAGSEVALMFEQGNQSRPLVLGLVQQPPEETGQKSTQDAATPHETAAVHAEAVAIQGEREVVLRCGDASITLRKDGRVVIRGAYVETRSKGVNRIKGGSVQIN